MFLPRLTLVKIMPVKLANKILKKQGFIKYFNNTSWLLAERIIRMIVSVSVGIWIARYLGPEEFGLFSYVQSFVGLFTIVAALGLDEIVIRELVKDETKRDELIGTAFILKLIGAFFTLILLAIAISFTSNDTYTNTLVFIVASTTIFQSFSVIDFYFQSKVQSKFVVFTNFIILVLSSVIKIILILTEASLTSFAWVVLFDSIVLAIGYIYFYQKNHMSLKTWKFESNVAFMLLKDSWPLILSGIVVSIYLRIDQVMINEMLDSEAVGQYAAAVKLSVGWYFIPMVVASSLFPAIINAKKQNIDTYYIRLQKLYDLMVWIAIAIAIPMLFLSDWVVNLLYGEQYNQAGSVLIIHVWAGVFAFLGIVSSKWFVAENLQRYSFYRTLTGAIINVILNYILIPIYSIYGAAVATIISQIIASYLFNAFNKKLLITFKMQTNAILLPLRKFGVHFKIT